jgi:hypothetical protein
MPFGQRPQACGESFEKGFVGARHRQRQREGDRFGAAGRQVAEVHGQRLVAQTLWRHGAEEMSAVDQHVAGHAPLHARRAGEQRAVVAHAEHGAAWRPREVPLDQLEFAQRHEANCGPGAAALRPRRRAAGWPARQRT